MARHVVVALVDDMDGSTAAETVAFGWRGQHYEIDLSAQHMTQLGEALSPYIEHARRVSAGSAVQATRRARTRGDRQRQASKTQAIRQWAREQGHEVSDRGRIPAQLQERYEREVGAGAEGLGGGRVAERVGRGAGRIQPAS
jgi:hypothetical protein